MHHGTIKIHFPHLIHSLIDSHITISVKETFKGILLIRGLLHFFSRLINHYMNIISGTNSQKCQWTGRWWTKHLCLEYNEDG